MSKFSDKLSRAAGGVFDSLRLSRIDIALKQKNAHFYFVAPENEYDAILSHKAELENAVEQAFETRLTVEVHIKKSHFDEYFFTLDVIKFFDSYPPLKGTVTKRCFDFAGDGSCAVTLSLAQSVYGFCESRNIFGALNEFIACNYCEQIPLSFLSVADEAAPEAEGKGAGYIYDNPVGRVIEVSGVKALIGKAINEQPRYIVDCVNPEKDAVLCGRIAELREFDGVSKKDQSPIKYYKFVLDDMTARVQCIYFATPETLPAVKMLKNGDEVVIKGELSYNTYKEVTTLSFRVKKLSECVFPADFKINRLKYTAADQYKYVFPEPYTDFKQQSAIERERPPAEFLMGKEFCVFDIETTGLSILDDKIVEIGAVKIKDGRITETFWTFVDPERAISESAFKQHGITEADVRGAYTDAEVLPDFFKFAGESTLVGHNLEQFDYPLVSYRAAKYNIYFDNPRLDTLVLARNNLNLKKYKLSAVAEHYGIRNPQAHRALSDAVTTARVFMQLAEFL